MHSNIVSAGVFAVILFSLSAPIIVLAIAARYVHKPRHQWSWGFFVKVWAMFCCLKWIVLAAIALAPDPANTLISYFSVIALAPEVFLIHFFVNIRTVTQMDWVRICVLLSFVTSAVISASIARLKDV